MALDNKTQTPRKSLIYAYSHFWLKNYANAVPTNLEKYATSALREQLFGLEVEGVSYFDQRLDLESVTTGYSPLRQAGRKLISRVLKRSSITKK
jgi:hypothetical protein